MSKKVILQVPYAFIVNKVGGRLVLFCEQMIFFYSRPKTVHSPETWCDLGRNGSHVTNKFQ